MARSRLAAARSRLAAATRSRLDSRSRHRRILGWVRRNTVGTRKVPALEEKVMVATETLMGAAAARSRPDSRSRHSRALGWARHSTVGTRKVPAMEAAAARSRPDSRSRHSRALGSPRHNTVGTSRVPGVDSLARRKATATAAVGTVMEAAAAAVSTLARRAAAVMEAVVPCCRLSRCYLLQSTSCAMLNTGYRPKPGGPPARDIGCCNCRALGIGRPLQSFGCR